MTDIEIIQMFEKDMNGLIEELYQTKSFFLIYYHLLSKTTNDDDVEILNKAPVFFQHTMKSLQASGLMSLSRMFESGARSGKNLFKFLTFLEAHHKCIFSKHKEIDGETINHLMIDIDKEKLNEVQDIINNLMNLRDKVLAHNDKAYFKNENLLTEKYPIKDVEIRKLIDLGSEILNKYQTAYNGKYTIMEVQNIYDVDKVMDALKINIII